MIKVISGTINSDIPVTRLRSNLTLMHLGEIRGRRKLIN